MQKTNEENGPNMHQNKATKTKRNLHTFRESDGFLLRFDSYHQITRCLRETFANSTPLLIAATMGKPCGQVECRSILKNAKSKVDALKYLSEQKKRENWGELSFHEINYEEAFGRIRVAKSFETREGKSNSPICYFFRGFLIGFLSQLYEKPIAVTEIMCMGKGDECCEFVFNKQ